MDNVERTSEPRLVVTLPAVGVYVWESQVCQYAKRGPRGISYFAGVVKDGVVDCLLFRDKHGKLRGILNHYSTRTAYQRPDNSWGFEQPGNVNVWVDPRFQRKGIASKLLAEAERRWAIDWEAQRYSEAGAALVRAHLSERKGARMQTWQA